jgi:steroid 5-alpha reductase family enzyme
MPEYLWPTLAFSLSVQAAFFVVAAGLKTDKVTDLSYGLTFVLLAVGLVRVSGRTAPAALVLSLMVAAWGMRLAGYLLFRILRMGRDKRFDGIRESPLSSCSSPAISARGPCWASRVPSPSRCCCSS